MPYDAAAQSITIPNGKSDPWPAFLGDLRTAIAADPRRASRFIEDGIRDLDHQLATTEAQIKRLAPTGIAGEVWARRRALLRGRLGDLQSLLPIRPDRFAQPAAGDAGGDPALVFLRRRVREAVGTLLQLRADDLPPEIAGLIPDEVQTSMSGKARNPSAQDLDSMWQILIGWTVAVPNPRLRQVLWLTGCGLSYRRAAMVLGISHTKVASLETAALLALHCWLLRHGN